jgi:hypothetical protein
MGTVLSIRSTISRGRPFDWPNGHRRLSDLNGDHKPDLAIAEPDGNASVFLNRCGLSDTVAFPCYW